MNIDVNKKLIGFFPEDSWDNPKRHISALVKGGKVLAYGESGLAGASKFSAIRGRSCHSEIAVLKYLNTDDRRKISKYTIWNIRWSRDGRIVNSKPCMNCQKVLLESGIKNIVYSTDDGLFCKTRLEDLICEPSSGFKY